jgi:hypothetical protein
VLQDRKTQLAQARRRPAILGSRRRIGDHEAAADRKQGSGTLGHNRRRPEAPSAGKVERTTKVKVATGEFGPLVPDLDPISPAQFKYGVFEEASASASAVEQRPPCLGPVVDQHQARKAPTTAQIDGPGGRIEPGSEPTGVLYLVLDRRGA